MAWKVIVAADYCSPGQEAVVDEVIAVLSQMDIGSVRIIPGTRTVLIPPDEVNFSTTEMIRLLEMSQVVKVVRESWWEMPLRRIGYLPDNWWFL